MDRRYTKTDLLKDVLFTLLTGILMYVYWAFVLMVASIILVNAWHVTWQQLLLLALGLTVVSLACYTVHLIRKRRRERETSSK